MTTTPIEHAISHCDADVDIDRPDSPCSVCDYIEDETGRRPAECCSKESPRYKVTIVACSEPGVTAVHSPVPEDDCSSDSSFDNDDLSYDTRALAVKLDDLAGKVGQMEKKLDSFIEVFSKRMQILEDHISRT